MFARGVPEEPSRQIQLTEPPGRRLLAQLSDYERNLPVTNEFVQLGLLTSSNRLISTFSVVATALATLNEHHCCESELDCIQQPQAEKLS